jgi:GNAT superfamily N-acetyltransferase
MTGEITIRPVAAADEAGWMALWRGYLEFYEEDIPEEVSRHTFARVLDPKAGHIGSLVAATAEGRLVGLLTYIVHEITWSQAPACYLEDLFVADDVRGQGIASALIERMVEIGKAAGWHRIYWNTARDNVRAQKLYNRLSERTGWVRYDIDLV